MARIAHHFSRWRSTRARALASLVALALGLQGCDLLGGEGALPGHAYLPCAPNTFFAQCERGSTCLDVPIQIDSRLPRTRYCSAQCQTAADCPTNTLLRDGGVGPITVACVAASSDPARCYQQCVGDSDCVSGLCRPVPGSASPVCVPDNSSFKWFGERCDPSLDHCPTGLSCAPAGVSSDPSRASSHSICTASCATDQDCRYAGRTAWGTACMARGSLSQCYERCDPGIACPEGMSCRYLAAAMGNVCVPPP